MIMVCVFNIHSPIPDRTILPPTEVAIMRLKLAATAAIALTAMPMAAFADGEVNIYSYRQAYLLEPLLNAFEKETG
ncbi:hypothetical protein MELB17_11173, partial [Marinobacter sp. ELB17]